MKCLRKANGKNEEVDIDKYLILFWLVVALLAVFFLPIVAPHLM